ncbi:MAG: hemerythrin domain-containing protein [Armatimonadetes bacterium]|nr:hemerythrin domain-containing protein [Armatimonadota bacterium]
MYATENLEADHRIIEVALPVLARLGEEAARGRMPEELPVEAVLDFIKTFADAYHHGKEEQHLFVALEARGVPRNEGLVFELLKEHGQARKHVRQLQAALGETSGSERERAREFSEHARGYVELLRTHIEKEDTQLWELAERALSPEDDDDLRAGYAAVEREVLGELGHEGYRKRSEQLAQG